MNRFRIWPIARWNIRVNVNVCMKNRSGVRSIESAFFPKPFSIIWVFFLYLGFVFFLLMFFLQERQQDKACISQEE